MNHALKKIKQVMLEQVASKQIKKEDAQKVLEEIILLERANSGHDDIAIIGLSCRFPYANSSAEFWTNLQQGCDAVGVFPKHRFEDVVRCSEAIWQEFKDVKTRPGCFLNHIDLFDHEFFNISPAEARVMAPSQRLFLEVAWEAIENAGYTHKTLDGSSTGVYVGYSASSGYERLIPSNDPNVDIGNTPAVIASRLNYAFNLKGPGVLVDTTCSSSLVALHTACQALKNKDCQQAIVGGISVILLPVWEELAAMGNEASDGRCKSFDASADGTNIAEGVGVVMLKPLKQALEDGNFIHAVIKGSAINSDARSNGLTAPNPAAQKEVITQAWRNARINPRDLSYIEAHGTGTKLGDPIEIKALSDAFQQYTSDTKWCPIGSVKTNIGHLDAAAGMASLIKVILSIQHSKIPASLHYKQPNPFIDFDHSSVYVNAMTSEWKTEKTPKKAGISSFGISGTNAHLVLQEAPKATLSASQERGEDVFCLSARSEQGLWQLLKRYKEISERLSAYSLSDICYTVNACREHYSHRIAFKVSSTKELLQILQRAAKDHHSLVNTGAIQYASIPTEVLSKKPLAAMQESMPQSADQLLDAYMKGNLIDYTQYYQKGLYRIVSLPSSILESKRHWPTLKVSPLTKKEEQTDSYLFDLEWVQQEQVQKEAVNITGNWIVFAPQTALGRMLIQSLENSGCKVFAIYSGEKFACQSENSFVVNSKVFKDYDAVFEKIGPEQLQEVNGIIHAWSCDKADHVMRSLEGITNSPFDGAYSAFYLAKLLRRYQMNQNIQMTVLTSQAHQLKGIDPVVYPTHAVLVGLNKVITQEIPKISTFCLDFDLINMTEGQIVQRAMQELTQNIKNRDDLVAYRSGKRYLQYLTTLDVKEYVESKIDIRDGDVFVFAGGGGYLGLQMCLSFAKKQKDLKFVLLSRSQMAPRETWEILLNTSSSESRIRYQIQLTREIEALGSTVIWKQVDVTNEKAVSQVLKDTRKQFGHIDSVIVAMKHINVKSIEEMPMGEYQDAVLSKLRGTWLLDQLTRQDSLRSFITFSSISSIMGGPVNSDCTSVNAFLDAFGDWRNLQKQNTVTLNLTEILTEDKKGTEHKITMLPPITYEEFLRAVDRVLTLKIPYSVIAAFDYKIMKVVLPRIKIRFAQHLLEKIQAAGDVIASDHAARDVNLTPEQIEVKLVEIWKEVLGYDSLSADADFFDNGGSSLSALKLLRLIEANLGAKFEVADLYTYSTVNQMKERICEIKGLVSEDNLMTLLETLEKKEISIEEATSMLLK